MFPKKTSEKNFRKSPLTVALLAGGESRRMGADKAALEIGGVSLLGRAALAAQEAGLPVLIVGRARPDGWPLPGVDFAPDDAPGRGPLGGLETALRRAPGPVLALACDLPLLAADALRWLAAEAQAQSGPHGLAVRRAGRWEPLFSVYTLPCLPLAQARLAEGRLSLHGLIEAGEFTPADAPDWVAAQLVNVNTPEEWERLTGAPRLVMRSGQGILSSMQDVRAQLASGALVCPRSGQALRADPEGAHLVTPDGLYRYPLLDGTVPVLLLDEDAMRAYAAGSARMTREYAPAPTPPRRSLPLRILRRLVYRGSEPQVRDYRTQASIDAGVQVTQGQPADAVCLSVGGGPGRCGDFTNVNIGPFPNVDVVADAHSLPYADGSVHAIFCEAVLEHLYDPPQAVREMRRVLTPGGLVFAATPFLQPYHGYPHHYQNFTLQGQENLFQRAGFQVVDSGVCVGPVHGIVMSIAVFLAQYGTSAFGRFVSRLWNFGSQFLYPFDRRLHALPNAHVLASTTYVLAKNRMRQTISKADNL